MPNLSLEQLQSLAKARARAAIAKNNEQINHSHDTNTTSNLLDAAVHGVADGLTFGFDDRIAAASQALYNKLINVNDEDYSELYKKYLSDYNSNRSKLYKDHPYIYNAGNIASSLIPMGAMMKVVKPAAKLGMGAAKLLDSALQGAAYSTADAYGHHQKDVTIPAIMGGITGGVLGAASSVPNKILSYIKQSGGERKFIDAVKKTNIPLSKIQQELGYAIEDKQNHFTIADALGDTGTAILYKLSKQPKTRQIIQNILSNRQNNQSSRVENNILEAFKQTSGSTADKIKNKLENLRKSQANIEYNTAKQNSSDVVPIQTLNLLKEQLQPYNIVKTTAKPELYSKLLNVKNMLSTKSKNLPFDYALVSKQAIADIISSDPKSSIAQTLAPIHNSLDKELENSSPLYRKANDNYAQNSRIIDAVDKGASAYRARAQNSINNYKQLTEAEKLAHNYGFTDQLLKKLANSPLDSNVSRDLLKDNLVNQYPTLAGQDNGMQFIRQLKRENTMYNTNKDAIAKRIPAENKDFNLFHALHSKFTIPLHFLAKSFENKKTKKQLLDILLSGANKETLQNLQNIQNKNVNFNIPSNLLQALGMNLINNTGS